MRLLQAANWMGPRLQWFAEVKALLQALMDERLVGTRKTKNVAKWRPLAMEDWTPETVGSREEVCCLLRDTARWKYLTPRWKVLMVPDASDMFCGCCPTQVDVEIYTEGRPVEQILPEPLGFVRGAFKGAQLNWPTLD